MNYCRNCGAPVQPGAAFCSACGTPQRFENNNYNDTYAMSAMDRFLRYERIAWKVAGIILLVSTILMAVLGVIYCVLPAMDSAVGRYARSSFLITGVIYIVLSLVVYLPLAIVNLKMVGKIDFYRNSMNTDISVARSRCTSVGMIVFGAIFNQIAMAFIIVNFVKTKNNAVAFDRIEAQQKGRI